MSVFVRRRQGAVGRRGRGREGLPGLWALGSSAQGSRAARRKEETMAGRGESRGLCVCVGWMDGKGRWSREREAGGRGKGRAGWLAGFRGGGAVGSEDQGLRVCGGEEKEVKSRGAERVAEDRQ